MMREKWTESERAILRASYPNLPKADVLIRLAHRSWDGIKRIARKEGLFRSRVSHVRSKKWPVAVVADAPLAYLAGFFDGEGSIQIPSRTPRRSGKSIYSLDISCANAHPRPIEMFYRFFGGRVSSSRRNERCHVSYQWRAHGSDAATILEALAPYLQVKAEQARIAVGFQRKYVDGQPWMQGKNIRTEIIEGRQRCQEEIHRLNRAFNFRGH